MYLKENFISIQGEGRFRGELSVFIRFAKCNRTCEELGVKYVVDGETRYGCDSYDSVDIAFKDMWQLVDSQTLINIVKKYNCNNIVITGGEPLVNINNEDFLLFMEWLEYNNYKITIETNGDIEIKDMILFKNVIFSISPKSQVKEKEYWFFNKQSYIKAIYNYEDVSTEYLKALQSKNIDIFMMPKGETSEQVEKQRKEVFEYCIENHFNFTDREHLHIFKEEAQNESIVMENMNQTLRYTKVAEVKKMEAIDKMF